MFASDHFMVEEEEDDDMDFSTNPVSSSSPSYVTAVDASEITRGRLGTGSATLGCREAQPEAQPEAQVEAQASVRRTKLMNCIIALWSVGKGIFGTF
mmetsp:Transcript_68746/g.173202  ORF Transcript_68746/g.173202 Transcript_68746/m.173202 type:complete len:97 (-) Transcript_68746:667-957(-)